ncbi:MAG: hypothetical protein HY554_16940 [Elusimicrobia bacterium]|nr:hypothetical protein [Elusimicrobiota bacterium]
MASPSAQNSAAEQRLVATTAGSGKTYGFNEEHDPSLPVDHWFNQTHEGEELFTVFYTQACLWSLCLGCNLPSMVSKRHVPSELIRRQVDHIFGRALSPARAAKLRKLIVSNNGSVLDERTFPTDALVYLAAEAVARCPRLAVLTLESRSEYVDEVELGALARRLREAGSQAAVELAVGFEAFDDRIRNGVFRKGLTLRCFEKTVALAVRHGMRIKAYFMLKPVAGLSEEDALRDIERGIEYLDGLARAKGARINMHLNPTYVARGTRLETAFREGRYAPPRLETLRRAALAAEGKRITVFLGLYDEHLAVEGGSFIRRGDGPLLERLRAFNKTQDFSCLKGGGPRP